MTKKKLRLTGGVLAIGALALGAGFAVGNSATSANASEVHEPEPIIETFGSSYGENQDWLLGIENDQEALEFFFRNQGEVASDIEASTGITPILEETEHGHNWIVENEDGSIDAFIIEEVHFDADGNIIE